MYISPILFNLKSNNQTSFGLKISPDLYGAMENLCDRVFVAQKYMVKRVRRDVKKYYLYCPVKNRLKKCHEIIQDSLPWSNPTLYPYIKTNGDAYLAINTKKGPKLLRQINIHKKNKPDDFKSLKLKLSDLEDVAEKLRKMTVQENLKVKISHFFDYFKLK